MSIVDSLNIRESDGHVRGQKIDSAHVRLIPEYSGNQQST